MTSKRDAYNERIEGYEPIGCFYAQRTEHGGKENLYAARIVHENEVVFTLRYTSLIEAGMFVLYAEKRMRILAVHEEGRRRHIHLKCLKSDGHD